jgi:type IV secretory pathway VirB2 component (pilin)
MNEKIPQHVILDLLPLYLADEVSDETRRLIEQYLKTDPQLATLAEQAMRATPLQEIPAPINKESEMEALKKVRKLMFQHNVFLALAVILTIMVGISYIFLWDEPWGAAARYVFGGLACIFWVAFFVVNRKISEE